MCVCVCVGVRACACACVRETHGIYTRREDCLGVFPTSVISRMWLLSTAASNINNNKKKKKETPLCHSPGEMKSREVGLSSRSSMDSLAAGVLPRLSCFSDSVSVVSQLLTLFRTYVETAVSGVHKLLHRTAVETAVSGVHKLLHCTGGVTTFYTLLFCRWLTSSVFTGRTAGIVGGSCHKYHFCRDKTRVGRGKTRLLSRQKYACHDKTFVATKLRL